MVKKILIIVTSASILAYLIVGAYFLFRGEPKTVLGAPASQATRDLIPDNDSERYIGTTTPSTLAYAGLIIDQICLTGDTCRTTWPGSSSSFNYDAFPIHVGNTSGTSTEMRFTGGLISTASSTFTSQLNVSGLLNASSTILGQNLIAYASSTFANSLSVAGRLQVGGNINASSTATSTFANGIQLDAGCIYKVSTGACLSEVPTNLTGILEEAGGVISTVTVSTATGIDYTGTTLSLASIPNTSLTNSSLTVNGTSIALGASGTITAASSTLLTDNNIFSGFNLFNGSFLSTASSTFSQGLIVAGLPFQASSTALFGGVAHFSNTNTSLLTVSTRVQFADEDGNQSDWSFKVANSGWPEMNLAVSSGSLASPTAVADTRIMGQLNFIGYDGNSYEESAYIRGTVDGTIGGNNVPGKLSFVLEATNGSAVERLTIRSSGNVGIGTTSPASLLSIQGNSLTSGTSTVNGLFATSSIMLGNTFSVAPDGHINITSTATSTIANGLTVGLTSDGLGVGTSTARGKASFDGEVTLGEYRVPTCTGGVTVDWSRGNKQVCIMTGNVTSVTFNQGDAGTVYRLNMCQDTTGNRTLIGWANTILFVTGDLSNATSTPGITTKAGTCNTFTFDTTNGTGTLRYQGTLPLKGY